MVDPLYKGRPMLGAQITPPPYPTVEPCDGEGAAGYEGAEGGEEWSLECLQTTNSEYNAHYLSPLPWRESSNSSQTGVCESRPLSMTDFEDTLFECDQAEQDFRKLSMELTEAEEIPEKICFIQQPTSEQRPLPTQATSVSPSGSTIATTESMQTKQMAKTHVDDVSRRLYKVLYGYDVELMDTDSEDVSMVASTEDTIQTGVRKDEVEGAAKYTNTNEDVSNSEHEIDVHQVLMSGDFDVKSPHGMNTTETATQALAGPCDVSCTIPGLLSEKTKLISSTGYIEMSHDSTSEQIGAHSVDNTMSVISGAECNVEKTLSFRQNENESSVESTPEIHSLVHDRSFSPDFVTDIAILQTESRASTPESALLVNELNFLVPDSPVPQFRPLSPLPPPVFSWETGYAEASTQGQPSLSAPGDSSMLLTSEAEERPLTPMVSNKRPFGRPVSLSSDYSGERSISPQSFTFDIEDRAESPESAILKTMQGIFTSSEHVALFPDFHEMRPSSPESCAHCRLSPDSPILEFEQVSESFTTCQCGSSPELVSSDLEPETVLLLSKPLEDRPSSPESVASINEHKTLSPDSPLPEFSLNWPDPAIVMIGERSTSPESICSDVDYSFVSPALLSLEDRVSSTSAAASENGSDSDLPVTEHRSPNLESAESAEIVCDSIHADHRRKSPKPSDFDTETKTQTPVESVFEDDDDWVIISMSDIEERLLLSESVLDYRPMSPQSAMLDIRASSPESERFNECLPPDSPIPQCTLSVHHAVTINDHSSSPEFKLSDTECEAMSLLSYFENRTLSPDLSDSVSDYGPNPATDLPLEEDMTLQPTQAAVVVEEECAGKQLETKIITDLEKSKTQEKYLTFILPKPEEENPMTHNETEAPKIESVIPDGSQCDQNIVTLPAGAEVLSTIITKELRHELFNEGNSKEKMYNPITEDTKSARQKTKQKKSVKTNYEPVQSVTECQKESSEFISTYEEIQDSAKVLSPLMCPETALNDLPSSFAFSTYVSEEQLPRESSVSVPQHHIPLPLPEYSVPVQSLAYDEEPWKLISQIRDPQYVGETFMSKIIFQFPGSRTVSFQTKSDVTVEDEAIALQCENDQRSLSPDSEAEYRPMSPQLLRSDSSQSGISVASQQALLPDSPVPQYFASGLFQVCHRSVSTNSVLSDLDLETDLNISFLFDDRPTSPDSLTSLNTYRELSPDSPIPAFTPSLAESVVIAKLDQSSSLESISSDLECMSVSSLELFAMNRPPSVYSVDESRPLSPEAPIPVFGQGLPEFAALARSSSPVSVRPDLEYGDVSLSQLSSEIRPPSPDSVVSGDDYRGDSPIPEFKTGLTESDSVIFDRSSSPESVVSDVEYTQASVDLSICEQGTSRVPAYRLVYDAELWKLISQIRDPHYVGKTVCSKTGVFEYAGTRIEYVLEDSDVKEGELEGGVKLDITDSSDANTLQAMQTKTEGKENPVSEYRSLSPGVLMTESVFFMLKESAADATFRTNQLICQLHDPHYVGEASANRAKVFEYEETSEECVLLDSNAEDRGRMISSDSEAEYRSLSPKPLKLLSFLNSDLQETGNSLDEYRPLCPDSHVPQLSVSLPKLSVKHKRPPSSKPVSDAELEQFDVANLSTRLSSPESEGSLGKHGSLSPDSPVPNFRPELQSSPVLYGGYRTSSPESGASELEDSPEFFPSEFCIQDRSDSPNAVTSEINRRPLSPESVTEYRPVSPELLMITTELRSSPDSTSSLHEFRTLSPDSPLLQFRQHIESAMLVSGRRSSSPVSVMSATEMDVLDMAFIEVQGRSLSPDSENEFRALSPDSPIPEFRQPILHPVISTAEYRSPSPESVCYSDIKYEYGSFLSVSDDRRTPSLDSVASGDERQASSPDSPVPQFMARVVKCFPMFVGSRSVSPESDTSDVESRQSGVSDSDLGCLSPDSPLPQYTMSASTVFGVGYRSTSPGSVYSDADLETDLCIPWLFEERAVSPGSTASKDEFRPLSSDSPIPEFIQALQESTISHMDLRSSSPESQLSDFDEEIELCFPVITEDRSSPESLASLNKYRRLSPDSPVPDFRQALLETYPEFNVYRSSSPESESSEIEYAPLISKIFDFEDRAQSRQSGVSDSDLGCLSPDSPLPQYTMSASTVFGVGYRSTSPGSVYSDADLETDLCTPWLFEERAVSPGSTASKDEFRPLSPDSPIPEFTQALQESTVLHMDLRSSSPESVWSDVEMESPCSAFLENRPPSLESRASMGLSPDSPLPDFMQPMFGISETICGCQSASPESTSSEMEYIVISLGSEVCENRPSSPGSGTSGDEYRALSPDSPIPEYRVAVHERVIVNVGYRSSSPESIESDIEYTWSEIFMTMNCGIEDRSDTPESIGSELQERPPSVESIPEYKPLSPAVLMLLGNILSVSPESTQSLDEHKRLSLDSPFPFLPQNVRETTAAETHYGCSSPESILLDTEYGLTFSDIEATDMRPLVPQSERSDDECKPLPSESPVPDFTKTFVENVMTVRDISPTEFSGSDDLSKTLDLFCLEERSASPEPFESGKEEFLLPPSPSILQLDVPMANEVPINRTDLSTATAPTSPEKVAVIVDDFIYGADLRKLISQVHDPQYAGETFSTKTGFMQFVGSTIKTSILDDVQDNKVKDKNDAIATAPPSEGTHPYTSTGIDRADDGFVCTSSAVLESPPPVIEPVLTSRAATHRQAKYMFETPAHEVQTESDDGLGAVFISDDLRYSPESLIDYMPISTNSAMVIEARASSPESVTSADECRPLSPDSPLPEFTVALPECVTFLRSASSSPETLASDIDYALSGNLESQFAECRLSPPESALSKNYNERERLLSSQSLSNYKLMLLESAMQMADKRASSPESMPEFNENRSLSPDSPIPQFTVSLEYTATHGSSSAESMGSDSECELMVTSSRDAETDRPSSRESISSISEFRRQLPDSPVPDFMRILSSYFMYPTYIDRSSSPVSFSSDSEFIALPIDCWIDDSPRPLSPQTVESEEELFCCEDTDRFVTKQEHLSHVTSPLLPGQSLPLPNKGPLAVSPSLIQTSETKPKKGHVSPDCQQMTDTYKWMQQGSEAENIITLHATVCEEDIQKDSLVKNILQVSAGELKNKTASQRAPPQTPEDTQFQTEPLSASAVTQDTNKIGAVFTHDKTMKSIPLKLPDQNSYTTHRTVTPVLPAPESTLCLRLDSSHGQSEWKLSPEKAQSSELFSPMSTQFLVPPDYEAVFSGHQTLRVSEFSQASLDDSSPVSPVFSDSISSQVVTEATTKGESENAEDFQFSPDFNRVLSEFQKTVSEFDSEDPKVLPKELRKGSETPQHSDSDVEFFDCRQALSDFSEPEEVKLKHEIYHISEPPSPLPGSSPSVGFLKRSPQYTAQPFLQVEDYKRFSSGSECLSEFAYDSEGRTEGDLPVCEELPSRDQAGYYDDDDFLGREIAEELGCLSTDSSEEEVLTTRVVRRRVIIQADNLPDMPPQTVTEEKYTDEHGNMVVKKITRKVIRKYVSADGMETQEVTVEGSHQETVQIEEGDTVSRVVKRTVLHSEGDQKELTFSEPLALGAATASEFEVEPVQGRKVSKVVKTTVVRGERMEKQTGDPSLAVDLPSARQDFEKALSYAGGFGKMLLPHVVEKEIVQDDGSVVKRVFGQKSPRGYEHQLKGSGRD
ncbi:ankyrin-2b isoform X2 [Epinephelus lanceolatus]